MKNRNKWYSNFSTRSWKPIQWPFVFLVVKNKRLVLVINFLERTSISVTTCSSRDVALWETYARWPQIRIKSQSLSLNLQACLQGRWDPPVRRQKLTAFTKTECHPWGFTLENIISVERVIQPGLLPCYPTSRVYVIKIRREIIWIQIAHTKFQRRSQRS